MKKIVLIAAAFVAQSALQAATDKSQIEQGMELHSQARYSEAYKQVRGGFDRNDADANDWFVLGIAAKSDGRFDTAIHAFEQVIELSGNTGRAKLELAEAVFQKGERSRARQLLNDVKADNPPPGVVANIDRFIAVIDSSATERKSWRADLGFGYIYDTNANSGPDTDTVRLFGLPFTLSEDAKGTEDEGFQTRVGFDHIHEFDRNLSLQSNFSASNTDYSELDELDSIYVSGSSGLTYSWDKVLWSVPLITDWVKVGHDNDYHSYSYGVAPQVRLSVSQKLNTSLSATVRKKKYKQSDTRNYTAWSLTPAAEYRVSKWGSVRASLGLAQENSATEVFSNQQRSASLSYFHNFSQRFVGTAAIQYVETQYEKRAAANPEPREDESTRFSLSLVYRLPEYDADVTLSTSYTDTRSNVDLNTHDRYQSTLGVRKRF